MWSPRFKLASVNEVRLEFLPKGREKSWNGGEMVFFPVFRLVSIEIWGLQVVGNMGFTSSSGLERYKEVRSMRTWLSSFC